MDMIRLIKLKEEIGQKSRREASLLFKVALKVSTQSPYGLQSEMILYLILLTCFSDLSGGLRSRSRLECGKSKANVNDMTVVEGSFAGATPWHVGIYRYNGTRYNNICCGSIISPNIVLTAANCVYNVGTLKASEPTEFKVVAGKLTYGWEEADSNAQELSVMSVHVHHTYLGDINSYSANIALLGLSSDFDFNEYVMPVCMDWQDTGINSDWKYIGFKRFQAAGWGFSRDSKYSPVLRHASLPFLDIRQCGRKFSSVRYRRFINHDKFCIVTQHGRQDGDSGSGVIFQNKGVNYIHGVLSANVADEFSVATNISKHLKWLKEEVEKIESIERCSGFLCHNGVCIMESLKCDGSADCEDGSDESKMHCGDLFDSDGNLKGSCILPKQRGGVSYTILDCKSAPCDLKALSSVKPNEEIQVNCGRGYASPDKKKQNVICRRGGWFPEEPECIKLCPPLKKENVDIKCVYQGESVSCKDYARPGTRLEYKCRQYYKKKDFFAFSGVTRCSPSGEWDETLPTCIPECGIVNQRNNVKPTISGGSETKFGKYPWHVGVFKFSNRSYTNICGGSIIHTHMVLTAAHCFFDVQTGIQINTSIVAVAAGKFKRNWYDHEEHQQSINAIDVIIPETYAGFRARLESDIAIINLAESFDLSDFVLPVCLDFDKRGIYPPNSEGTIVGWGETEKGTASENLKEISMSYIGRQECRKRFVNFTMWITTDKFCVIYRNGSGAQSGDSGGGMTFPRDNVHFIHGIVSLKSGNNFLFSALTNVTNHLEFIRDTINRYSRTK